MRKLLACFLALLMCCTGLTAFAESLTLPEVLPKSYFLEAAQQDYPDWQVWKVTYSGYGRYENEIAIHIFVNLYRFTNDCIELMELDAITNPIQEGDDVPWSVTTLIPVELAPGAADTLRAMDGKDIFTISSRAVFSDTVTDLLMPSQHTADETVVQLMSSSQFLYYVTKDSAEQYMLRIAKWDGSEYTTVVSTPSPAKLSFNPAFSSDNTLELDANLSPYLEVDCKFDADGVWRIHTLNNDAYFVTVYDNYIIKTYWSNEQNNDDYHYGRLTLPITLNEVDFAAFPRTFAEVLSSMDYTGVACTAHDDTPLYAAPDGGVLAYCYTRVPMVVISESGDWREVQLGGDADGLRCWVRAADLAFGADTENVVCTFPTHRAVDRVQKAVSFSGKARALEDGTAWWIIGVLPNGDYLMMYAGDEEMFVGTAPASAFSELGETEHGYWNADWAPDGGWDEDDDWHNND
jgi:hypothetical protein